MNDFKENMAGTPERTLAERHIESVRQQGGFFVEAVRVTRMPMIVTDAMPYDVQTVAKLGTRTAGWLCSSVFKDTPRDARAVAADRDPGCLLGKLEEGT